MDIPALSSHIDSVTVYRQGALISRSARLPAGQPARIKLVNLPLGLDDGSLRVRVDREDADTPAAGPVATDVRVVLDLPVADDSLPPPDDEALEQARWDVQDIEERVAHLEARRRRLERLQLVSRPGGKRGDAPPPSPVDARLALFDFRHRAMVALDDELDATRAQLRHATRIRDELGQRHRAASTARQVRPHELRKAAVVSLGGQTDDRTEPGTPARIVIEYMVPGARWAPSYSVHLTRDMSQATVSVRAVVAQRTGEDWTGVRLTLATADAQRWVDLPELQALRIGRRQPMVPRRGWRAPPAGAAELYADYDRVAADLLRGEPPSVAAPRGEPADALFDDEQTPTWDSSHTMADEDFETSPAAELAFPEAEKMVRSRAPAKKQRPYAARSGGPPPPPAPAPAQPARASAPPAPQTLMMAAPQAMAPPGGAAMGFGGGAAPPAEPPPGAHEIAPEQLAYGDLRMPGPGDGRRGTLVVARRQERYLELLWVRETIRASELAIDVSDLIDAAFHQALAVGNRALPPRHHPAAAWDGFDYAYAAESTVDIPSDGAYHGVPLMGRTARVSLGYVVVPRESTDVFRRLTLHNPLEAPLLPGPADIYVGGDYLLTADLRATPQRGTVDIGLGVEQAIKVSRNTRFAEESAGLMGGSLSLRHEIAIEVANRRDRPVQVEVQERIPVTRDKEDEIQVDVGQVEPAWSAFEPEEYPLQGGYRWRVQVPPGEQKTLRAVYTIKISAKKELAGGNRREP